MTKQERIEELEKENQRLRNTVADYRARHDVAICALSQISQNVGVKPAWFDGSWEKALAYSAAMTLVQISKMRLRE
jgi:hypothetical protein